MWLSYRHASGGSCITATEKVLLMETANFISKDGAVSKRSSNDNLRLVCAEPNSFLGQHFLSAGPEQKFYGDINRLDLLVR